MLNFQQQPQFQSQLTIESQISKPSPLKDLSDSPASGFSLESLISTASTDQFNSQSPNQKTRSKEIFDDESKSTGYFLSNTQNNTQDELKEVLEAEEELQSIWKSEQNREVRSHQKVLINSAPRLRKSETKFSTPLFNQARQNHHFQNRELSIQMPLLIDRPSNPQPRIPKLIENNQWLTDSHERVSQEEYMDFNSQWFPYNDQHFQHSFNSLLEDSNHYTQTLSRTDSYAFEE